MDLRRLLFELSAQDLNFLMLPRADHLEIALQLGDRGLLFLDFFVLFEEFVEQHRVHLLVAHLSAAPLSVLKCNC